jgi:SAM-dependent methyltransferase
MTATLSKEAIHQAVQEQYGALARNHGKSKPAAKGGESCCGPTCCSSEAAVAPDSPDYSREELASVPKDAYLGAGSGNPTRHAALQPGETVIDLGAGAGMDSFLAANAVGPGGRVHGFDLTADMLARARSNAAVGGYRNVSFERADIERLPIADAAADAAISNCVINLAPDKAAVYRDMFRALRPGGRFSVADIVLRGPAEALQAFRAAVHKDNWCGCVSGALAQEEYLDAIRSAGFADVRVVAERPAELQPGGALQAVAVTITGRKPA